MRARKPQSGALAGLMGWRQPGVRITVQVPDETGQLARVAGAIAEVCGLLAGWAYVPARLQPTQRRHTATLPIASRSLPAMRSICPPVTT